jgi:hypothetical protein
MSTSLRGLTLLCTLAAAHVAYGDDPQPMQSPAAQTPSAQAMADARAACDTDLKKLCPGVQPGGGRIIACLKQHKDELSNGCKQAIAKAMHGSSGDASPTTPATPTTPTTPTAPATPTAPTTQAAPRAADHHASATAAALAATDHFFLMKRVQIIDQGQGKPAYELMIPTTWEFKGWVNVNAAEGGCFADWFSVLGVANSADHSIELQLLPQSTWQYIDDPTAQRYLQQDSKEGARVGLKPCPLRAPIHAADFLRQDIIAKYRKAKTILSVEPFPELEQMARHRLGLPPDPAASTSGAVRTEAARARLAYDDDKGRPVEEWVTAVIVVRTLPGSGRGASYDWHAIMLMSLRTPKGQLDANDKLFKLIASTIHPDPKWQVYSNGVIATLYRKKQEEEAKRSAIIAQFQNQVIQTINGVVANQQAGSFNSASGADQLIRSVQTFRDPGSGATFELSNQYDHAWLNGSNEYVMSDDPNFNPNGYLNGNWTSLQPVRAQP